MHGRMRTGGNHIDHEINNSRGGQIVIPKALCELEFKKKKHEQSHDHLQLPWAQSEKDE